jgi:DNA-binding LacI/PurR family transcriptional regulator
MGTKKSAYVPKHVKLREKLRAQINQMQPGQMLPSILKLRAEHQVSQATVDRAIRKLCTEGLLVSRQGSGIYVSEMAKIKRVGVFFSIDLSNWNRSPFYCTLLERFQAACCGEGKLLSYYLNDVHHNSDEHGPNRLQLDALTGQLDGLLAIGVPSGKYWENLVALGVPVEAWGSSTRCPQRVYADYSGMIRLCVESLISQGSRRIAFLWPDRENGFSFQQEVPVFYEAIACGAATTSRQWIIGVDVGETPMVLAGYSQFQKIWKSWDEKPDGIVCSNDNFTTSMLHAAEVMGLDVPGKLKIATHANKGLPQPCPDRVTRVEFDIDEIAAVMLKRLDQRMAGKTPKPDILKIQASLYGKHQPNVADSSDLMASL